MKLYLYNTLTRQKEEFVPLVSGKVGMYSCGPTVYRNPSIGNYRATFTADLIRNTLKLLGYQVTAVMNITDVGHLVSDADDGEDKLEKGSKREGISAWDVAKKYEEIFKEGMKQLNIDEFDVMPRATEHIQEQIELVQTLEKKGYTYVVDGDGIYMDTTKVEDYGKLMGPNYKKRLEELNAGERINMGGKKHPTDFALWKFSPIGEKRQMERDPKDFGADRPVGFPGWHIECSAMSSKYLGQQFDIHHGGADHITIHHPNEIAQSECAFDKHPWVKYWIHNEFLQVDGGKMSKSLGNVYNLKDIEAKGFSPLDLRYFYFMAQYGSFQNFTWDQLEAAKNSRKNLSKSVSILKEMLSLDFSGVKLDENLIFKSDDAEKFYNVLLGILCDNINTPKLLSEIFKEINKFSKQVPIISEKLKNIIEDPTISNFSLEDRPYLENLLIIIYYLDQNLLKLGLFQQEAVIEIPSEITAFADQRLQAKQDKNYALADELRNKITELGWNIKDGKDGYEITKI